MSRTNDKPLLLSLQKVAREVGVNPDTIVKHPEDFFPVLNLGQKRYVANEAYVAWRKTLLSEAVPEAVAGCGQGRYEVLFSRRKRGSDDRE